MTSACALVAAWSIACAAACGGASNAPPRPPADAPKRPAAPPIATPDERPIEPGTFTESLNPRDAANRTIHASDDGGCHVYVRDGKRRPPGAFPPAAPIACPPDMLAPEWGYCTGAGTVQATSARDECICSPGDGDPPPKPFRMPCPR